MATTSESSKIRLLEPGTSPTLQSNGGNAASVSLVYRLLVNRTDAYLTAILGQWFAKNQQLTPQLISEALEGHVPLSLRTVSGIGTSRWSCLDLDADADIDVLLSVSREIYDQGHVLVEYSRRGLHVFLFHQSTYWENAHRYASGLVESLEMKDLDIFPKHGNAHAVKLPGSIHPKTDTVYPIVNPITGEILTIHEALAAITPIAIPEAASVRVSTPSNGRHAGTPEEFEALVTGLEALTQVRIYAPERASARCPWHKDDHPSLYIKGRRFHCLSSRCGVFGDIYDIRRFIERGIRPPQG